MTKSGAMLKKTGLIAMEHKDVTIIYAHKHYSHTSAAMFVQHADAVGRSKAVVLRHCQVRVRNGTEQCCARPLSKFRPSDACITGACQHVYMVDQWT